MQIVPIIGSYSDIAEQQNQLGQLEITGLLQETAGHHNCIRGRSTGTWYAASMMT